VEQGGGTALTGAVDKTKRKRAKYFILQSDQILPFKRADLSLE
jgi:hypothetical protein